mmetsp:Transcript_14409/g.33517  ORF Transcript_14409/g.33517 Transcript_14409/m.33517 type:complete len:88 (+) Transcript_14409:137-400(+)
MHLQTRTVEVMSKSPEARGSESRALPANMNNRSDMKNYHLLKTRVGQYRFARESDVAHATPVFFLSRAGPKNARQQRRKQHRHGHPP